MSTLGEGFEAARRRSRGQVVLVSGEAGVGKTALLRRFCGELPQSARVLWGGCDPLFTPRPLGALLAVAEAAGGELEEVVTSGVLPHEVVAALARELRAGAPTVFVLEDVHWADEATLDVLRLLVRRIETVPALIVVSYRDDELARAHPLRIVLGELAIESGGWTAEARCAVARRRSRSWPSRTASMRASCTARPPAIRSSSSRRSPRAPMRSRTRSGTRSSPVPRASALGRGGCSRRWQPSRRRPSSGCSRRSPAEAVDALDECLTSGMLASEPAGIAFRHELARLAVEESIPLNRRVDLHRRALAALADPPRGARSGPARAPRRGGRRRRRGASLRTRGGRPRGVARRAP